MGEILIVLFYVMAPFAILHLCYKFTFLNKIGPVILAYIVGILLALTNIVEFESADKIQDTLMNVTIPLGIPLILFSTHLKEAFRLAKTTMLSLLVAVLGVIVAVVAGYLIFGGNKSSQLDVIGSLLVGVYTGGTPNLASLKLLLNVEPSVYILVHSYDMLISTLHLFFLMMLGQKVLGFILPSFNFSKFSQKIEDYKQEDEEYLWGLLQKKNLVSLLKGLGLAFIVVALSAGFMFMVDSEYEMVVFILSVTSLSLIASTFKKVRILPKTFDLGMYFILVFSVVVASKIELAYFTQIDWNALFYLLFVVFGALILHVLMSKIFKIDRDTVIITSTALVCSPPFVPVVAGAIKNKEIIVPGMAVGIIGYAIGNYLGYLMSLLLPILG